MKSKPSSRSPSKRKDPNVSDKPKSKDAAPTLQGDVDDKKTLESMYALLHKVRAGLNVAGGELAQVKETTKREMAIYRGRNAGKVITELFKLLDDAIGSN